MKATRKHKLLSKALAAKIPPMNSEDCSGIKPIAVKYFCPYNQWTWYVFEGEEIDGEWMFYAMTEGNEKELGYVSLTELENATINIGGYDLPAVERDLYFNGYFYDIENKQVVTDSTRGESVGVS